VIKDNWVKKVLMGRGSSINVTFPQILKALGISITDLHESDTPFFGIVPTEGEYLLHHTSQPMMFGMPDNYHNEFLRFEVVRFNYAYNAIIEGLELAKFMVAPHYSYMMLNMLGPQGIITMKADCQASTECYRGAIHTSLASSTSVA
jgi:hypothetical protein